MRRDFEQTNRFSVETVIAAERDRPFIAHVGIFESEQGRDFAAVPFVEKQHVLLARLNELVHMMKLNPVHREKLKAIGEITSFEDFARVPITTRQDLKQLYTDTKEGLVIPFSAGGHKLIASGGSTGEPVLSVYRTAELQHIGQRGGEFLRNYVIGSAEPVTVLSLFDDVNGWASSQLVQTILDGIPGASTIPAGEITLPRVADFFVKQGVTDIAGLPSNFSHLVTMLEEINPGGTYPGVKRALYGGEFMDPIIRDQLLRAFPNIQLVDIYSSTQADCLAMQVGDELRILDEVNYIEILDEEGNSVPDGQVGRIIITRLMGNGDQPLRLDMQDRGAILPADPTDPLQARRLILQGRMGDYLRVSTWDILATDLLETSHQALQQIMDLSAIQARQLVVDDQGIHLRLALGDPSKMETLDPAAQFQIMHKAIMDAVGFFEDPHNFPPSIQLTIEFVFIDALERTSAGKIHPFVNKRK